MNQPCVHARVCSPKHEGGALPSAREQKPCMVVVGNTQGEGTDILVVAKGQGKDRALPDSLCLMCRRIT
jgi:hypothetical protein